MTFATTQSSRLYAQLFAIGGPLKGKVYRVRSTLTMGRGAVADVRLDDPKVSRRNTRIWVNESGHLMIKDLDSKNGTRVDNQLVREQLLPSGSVVCVGETEFLVQLTAEHRDSTRPAIPRLLLPGDPLEERTLDGEALGADQGQN